MVSEAELLEGIRAQSQRAVELLYEQYCPRVRGAAIRQLGDENPDAIDDVVSETFTRFLTAVQERGVTVTNVGGHLCAIARNLAVDRHREQRRVVLVSNFDDSPVVSALDERDADGSIADGRWGVMRPSRELDAQFERVAALAAFNRLSPSARAVLALVLESDESIGRLAAMHGMSAQGLSSAIYRAVERLRQEFVVAHLLPSEVPACWRCVRSLGALVRGGARVRRHGDVIGHLEVCGECRARLGAALEADGELPHGRRHRRDHGGRPSDGG